MYRGDLDPVRTGLQLIPITTAKKKNFFITHPDEEALHLFLSHLSSGVQKAIVPARLNATGCGGGQTYLFWNLNKNICTYQHL